MLLYNIAKYMHLSSQWYNKNDWQIYIHPTAISMAESTLLFRWPIFVFNLIIIIFKKYFFFFPHEEMSKSTLWPVTVAHDHVVSWFLYRVMTFEFSWYISVQFTDHLVDCLLPGWITIFAHWNGNVKLSQCNLSNFQESVGHLWIHTRISLMGERGNISPLLPFCSVCRRQIVWIVYGTIF